MLALFLSNLFILCSTSALQMNSSFPYENLFLSLNSTDRFEETKMAKSRLEGDEYIEPIAHTPYALVKTLPVGTGDATIVECRIHPSLSPFFSLIDFGSLMPAMTMDQYHNYIRNMISEEKILNHIFLTHPDRDHVNYGYCKLPNKPELGLLVKLVEWQYKRIVTIHISSIAEWVKYGYSDMITFIRKNSNIFQINDISAMEGRKQIDICGNPSQIKMNIIYNNPEATNKNAISMVMSLINFEGTNENMGSKMLFLGDFEKTANYRKLYDNHQEELRADVVMVPHHGSNYDGNGDPYFYQIVQAKHAIISSNIDRTGYNHPQLSTIMSFCMSLIYQIDFVSSVVLDPIAQAYSSGNGNWKYEVEVASGIGKWKWQAEPLILAERWRVRPAICEERVHQTTLLTPDYQEIRARIIETKLFNNRYQMPEVTEVTYQHFDISTSVQIENAECFEEETN